MPAFGRPKILFATPVFPNTTEYGLAMRAGALLEALAAHGDVYLLIIPVYDPCRKALPESMLPFCAEYRILNISRFKRVMARLKNAAQHLQDASMQPFFSLFNSRHLRNAVDQAYENTEFDYIYIFRLYMAPLMRAYLSAPSLKGKYLDLDDIESITRSKLAALYRKNGLEEKACQEEKAAQQFAEFERKLLPQFDGVAVCSQIDKNRISEYLPKKNLHILPNVVRQRQNVSVAGKSNIFNMLFVGNLNYYPNQDALAYFMEEIMPLMRSRAKQRFRFTIVGSGEWPGLQRYQEIAECDFVGFVEDVAPYYQQADAVVVPLRAGGGTRIKILEAFSFKRPVIATKIGIEGIEAVHEKHALIAGEAADFAEQCCRIMEDPQLANYLTGNAIACLHQHYTIDVLRQRFRNILK